MRFLVDADLPRSTADLLRRYGHIAVDVRDVGLGSAPDGRIADYARGGALVLITGDFGFADVRNYPPEQYPGLVVVGVPRNAAARMILGQIESFLRQPGIVLRTPGRLAILEPGRLRLRPR